MNVWEQMESCKDDLTPKEMEIYELVKKDPYSFTASTAMEIASRYNVAQSAISRFCQKVGFSGFADFRLSMILATSTRLSGLDGSSSLDQPHDFTYYLCAIIQQTKKVLPDSVLDQLAARILQSTTVYTSGYGSSLSAAHSLAFLMTCSGIPGHFLTPSLEMETLHVIKSTDIIFLFSVSNPSHRDFLSLVADMPADKRPYTILINNTNRHPLRNKVSQVITLPDWLSMHISFMINNTVPQFAFCHFLMDRVNRLLVDHGSECEK